MPVPAATTPSSVDATLVGAPPPGRLGLLTALAIAASAVPVPIVPDRIVDRVRGAIAHDTASRHGISLTTESRAVLAAPGGLDRAAAVKALEMLITTVLRRLGPLGAAVFAARGLETFALGHLFELYLAKHRKERGVRMQPDEARHVRSLIDRSVVRAFSPNVRPAVATLPGPVEDVRDEWTRWSDALLLTTATLPSYVERRLEAAFEAVVAEASPYGG
ncbi:MAG: hypothetical protein R3B70_10920 [Polyangiaceae bacterium]